MRWSVSTDHAMRQCERQTFLTQRYASHTANDPDRRRAWILKQAQSQEQWIGSAIHVVLAAKLTSGLTTGLCSSPELVAACRDLGERQLAFSAAGRFNEGTPKTAVGSTFRVLEWDAIPGRLRPDDPLADLIETAVRCFSNLQEAPAKAVLDDLAAASEVATERNLTFHVGAHTAVASLDVLASGPSGHQVVDWKVSRSPTADNAFQLDSYALAVALSVPGAAAGAIRVSEVNLVTGAVRQRTPTLKDLDETENAIRASATAMGSLDPENEDLAVFAAGLLVADNPNTCSMCSLQSLCQKLESLARYRDPEPQERLILAC